MHHQHEITHHTWLLPPGTEHLSLNHSQSMSLIVSQLLLVKRVSSPTTIAPSHYPRSEQLSED